MLHDFSDSQTKSNRQKMNNIWVIHVEFISQLMQTELVHDLAGHHISQVLQCCSKSRCRQWNQQQRSLAATLNIWSMDPPPFSLVSCHKFSGPCLASFFLITAYSWRTAKSTEKVILVQKGFWSGTLSSLFSAGLWSSIVFNCSQLF